MKSFTTIAVIAASAAVSSAQLISNPNGTFTCPIANGSYCAGESLSINIIIRCLNGVGSPGNCNDNLSGEFPTGVNYAPCYQTSDASGDAACSKNCVVYEGSGNTNRTDYFTLPTSVCRPSTTQSSSMSSTTIRTITLPGSGTGIPITGTGSPVYPTNGTSPIYPSSTGRSGGAGSATATPIAPTSTTGSPSTYTGAAVANKAGSALAAVGILAAYFL